MSKVANSANRCTRRSTPRQAPLLDYAENARVRALPLSARWVAKTRGLPAATALLIAEIAFGRGSDK